jgi:hypothetical protein
MAVVVPKFSGIMQQHGSQTGDYSLLEREIQEQKREDCEYQPHNHCAW